MYCTNCGNKMSKKEKFCTSCGMSADGVQPVPPLPTTPVDNSKSKKSAIIIIVVIVALIVLGILAIIGVTFFIVFSVIGKLQTEEYVNLDSYRVPSVYKVLDDNRYICSYNSHYDVTLEKTVEIDYCNHLSDEDVEHYYDYLIEKEGFVEREDMTGKVIEKTVGNFTYSIFVDSSDKMVYTSMKINPTVEG